MVILKDSNMPDPFEIIVGTYEQFLLGYKVENVVNEYKAEKSFATHNHLASIRSVASNKHYLASGGADDSIYLYDMRYRAESGRLVHHNDTVNCVTFTPEASHLFTCSNDGTIAAIRCGNWQVEKHWLKPHNGLPVNTLAIHPTGKIALSTGADGTLRTWNLIKGRQAYATNLIPRLKLDAKHVNLLRWSPDGGKYLLAVNQKIDIYSTESAGITAEIKFDSKVASVEFLSDELIAVGLENGYIKFYDIEKNVLTVDINAHDARVKCIVSNKDFLVSASSAGEIKVWKFTKYSLDLLETINCGARITCLSVAMPCKILNQKKQTKVEEKTKIKKKNKIRLKQEVIVEHDDDWEVTDINDKQNKPDKSSKKKRTEVEEAQEDDTISHKKKKKKKSHTDDKNATNISKRKRDKESSVIDLVSNSPNKKKKLAVDSMSSAITSKKRKDTETPEVTTLTSSKKKLKVTDSNTDISQKTKLVQLDSTSVPKKKKKKAKSEELDISSEKKKKKVAQQ